MASAIRTARTRHLRHRALDGLVRGSPGVPRLRHVDGWLAARADTAANGGIGDTAATIAITGVATGADTLTATAHGIAAAAGPYEFTGGDLPNGLDTTSSYWLGVVDVNTLSVHTRFEDAVNDANRVDLLDAGSGTRATAKASSKTGLTNLMRMGVRPATIQGATDLDAL